MPQAQQAGMTPAEVKAMIEQHMAHGHAGNALANARPGPYVHEPYPKVKYKAGRPKRGEDAAPLLQMVVNSAEEEAALDPSWFDKPDFTNHPRAVPAARED